MVAIIDAFPFIASIKYETEIISIKVESVMLKNLFATAQGSQFFILVFKESFFIIFIFLLSL